jgi:hypothetical protein
MSQVALTGYDFFTDYSFLFSLSPLSMTDLKGALLV